MTDLKEYVVVCKEGADCDSLWHDIENQVASATIPDRPVSIADNRDPWPTMCNYWLTDQEAEQIKSDPRVEGVEIPLKNLPDDIISLFTMQTGDFNKPVNPPNSSGLAVNWGLIRHSFDFNVYGMSADTTEKYGYVLDGTGVDVVIWDSGLQIDHPEFQDANGQSRVKTINWYQAAGIAGNMPPNFYTDINGHGTACAGIVAGKTFGWAKNAHIYVMNTVPFVEGRSIDVETASRLITKWHIKKNTPGDPIYTGRPTVVNASFGSVLSMNANFLLGGKYRGIEWSSNNWDIHWASRGINPSYGQVPYWSAESNNWISSMEAAGVIVCKAIGNSGYKASTISVNANDDSNNTATMIGQVFGPVFYMRGSSPFGSKSIIVGALDTDPKTASQDKKAGYSNAGSLVKIYGASGGDAFPSVMTATSTTNTYGSFAENYRNVGPYKQVYFSGTSCACPQITGMVALYLQVNPAATPDDALAWVLGPNTQASLYSTGQDSDYTDVESQWGGSGRVAYQNLQAVVNMRRGGQWQPAKAVSVKNALGTWDKVSKIWEKTDTGWKEIFRSPV